VAAPDFFGRAGWTVASENDESKLPRNVVVLTPPPPPPPFSFLCYCLRLPLTMNVNFLFITIREIDRVDFSGASSNEFFFYFSGFAPDRKIRLPPSLELKSIRLY